MPIGGKVVKVLMDTARNEVDVMKSFLTEPKGVFETVDQAIVVARKGAKDIVSSITSGGFLQGGIMRRVLKR